MLQCLLIIVLLLHIDHVMYLCGNWQEASSYQRRVIFTLEAASPAICLLVQLEKHVTEEGGVTGNVYSRKEPVSFYPKHIWTMKSYYLSP